MSLIYSEAKVLPFQLVVYDDLAYGCNDLSTIFDNEDDDLIIPSPGKITADRTPQIDVVNYVTRDTAPIFLSLPL